MPNSFYKVNPSDVPLTTDVNQYADAFQGNADVGQLNFADPLSNPSTAPTATTASGSGLSVGSYFYGYTFVTGYRKSNGNLIINGETRISPAATVTTTSGNQVVNLSGIATSSAPYVIARRIYRTKVNPSTAPTLSASGTTYSLPSGVYYVKYTWVYTGGGESASSPEASQSVSSGQQLTVTLPPFPPGVASANIYVSTSSGNETYQRNITTTSTSFTSPISSGGGIAPLGNNTYYLVTQLNDNVTTTFVDSTADNSLSTTQPPTFNTTGTYFSKINISTPGNDPIIGSINVTGGFQGGIHVQSSNTNNGNLFNETVYGNYITGNAYFDGSNWWRYMTGNPACALAVVNNQDPQFWTAGSGSGSITWNQYRLFHEGNYNTRTHVEVYLNSNQTFSSANTWYRVMFNVVNVDYLSEFSTTNGYITVLQSGVYAINYTLRFENLSTSPGTTIITGTNQINRSGNYYNVTQQVVTNSPVNINGSQTLYLPAGTQLEVRAQVDNTNSGTARIGGYNYTTFLEISRIA